MGRLVRRWTDEEIAMVREMHTAGKAHYLIANKIGRSTRAVQRIISAQKTEPSDAETDA